MCASLLWRFIEVDPAHRSRCQKQQLGVSPDAKEKTTPEVPPVCPPCQAKAVLLAERQNRSCKASSHGSDHAPEDNST